MARDALPLRRTWRVAACVLRFFVVIRNSGNFVVLFLFDLVLTDDFDVFSTGFDSRFWLFDDLDKCLVIWIPIKILSC